MHILYEYHMHRVSNAYVKQCACVQNFKIHARLFLHGQFLTAVSLPPFLILLSKRGTIFNEVVYILDLCGGQCFVYWVPVTAHLQTHYGRAVGYCELLCKIECLNMNFRKMWAQKQTLKYRNSCIASCVLSSLQQYALIRKLNNNIVKKIDFRPHFSSSFSWAYGWPQSPFWGSWIPSVPISLCCSCLGAARTLGELHAHLPPQAGDTALQEVLRCTSPSHGKCLSHGISGFVESPALLDSSLQTCLSLAFYL